MVKLNKVLLKLVFASAAIVMVFALTPNASAQETGKTGANKSISVGYLECHVASGWGIIFGSSRDLKCVFTPTEGYPEYYTGHISKFGADIGYLRSAVMLWGVFAPQMNLGRGALAGNYAGATASATVGVGAGVSALFGGWHNSIALQPITIQGNTGLNVAAGVETLTLNWDVHHEIGPGKPKP